MSIFDNPTTPDLGTTSTEGVAAPVETPAVETPVVDSPVTSPIEGGVVEAPPTPQYLDIDQYGDHLVKLKIDGEETELPFKSVRDGLMMQQAFTRRTQELAEEKRRLYQAEALVAMIEQNPAEVIAQLAEANDLDIHAGLRPIERTPEEAAIRSQQQQLTQMRAQTAQAQLNADIAQIRAQYGDFDVYEAAKFATDNGIPNLPMAYRLMRAEQQEREAASAAEAQRRQQAAAAAQVVHQGASVQAGSVTTPPKPVSSVRDAWLAAKAELNR